MLLFQQLIQRFEKSGLFLKIADNNCFCFQTSVVIILGGHEVHLQTVPKSVEHLKITLLAKGWLVHAICRVDRKEASDEDLKGEKEKKRKEFFLGLMFFL